MTAFLRALHFRGCPFQAGSDMLFEQVPAYPKFFDFSTTTLDERLDETRSTDIVATGRSDWRSSAQTSPPPAKRLRYSDGHIRHAPAV